MDNRAFPLTQNILVKGKTIERVYKILLIWLSENNCRITRETPQEEIEAEYSGDYPLFEVGPRDIYPKTLYIRLSGFGSDVQVNVRISQKIAGRVDDGYVYWGTKLQGLYEVLGVEVDDQVISELFPEEVLEDNIESRTKRFAAIVIVSVLIVAFLWEQFKDVSLMYKSVVLLPIVALAYWDLQTYRNRLKKQQQVT
jgi:hypothetical protein